MSDEQTVKGTEQLRAAVEALMEPVTATAIGRDLSLNLKKLLLDSSLDGLDAAALLLSLAASVKHSRLAEIAVAELSALGASEEVIAEARESAAIMAMNNAYYRFRHMLGSDEQEYKAAGLRMQSLARPALGKPRFELLAFAVSVVNGCQDCIRSHENALRQHGTDVRKIHDAARLAAVVRGVETLLR